MAELQTTEGATAAEAGSSGISDAPTSVTLLQAELRAEFADRSPHRALAESLRCIAEYLGADSAVAHGRVGSHLLSEEWVREGTQLDDELREAMTGTMWQAMSSGNAMCARLGKHEGEAVAVLAALMYDGAFEQVGTAALLVRSCPRARAAEILGVFEGILGYLTLLATTETEVQARVAREEARTRAAEIGGDGEHPVRLAFAMAADVVNRHGVDMAAIGYVDGSRVRVAAVSGMATLRPANPGVKLIQAAMGECLDRKIAIIHRGTELDDEDDCRLHAQWSRALGGDSVASFPLIFRNEIVAIVSVRQGATAGIDHRLLQGIGGELEGYAALVPLSRLASRGLLAHGIEACRRSCRKLLEQRRARVITLAIGTVALLAWLLFGQLPFGFTVPCEVRPASQWVVSSPRDGVLTGLFVRPGDIVAKGQLLASLEAQADILRRQELHAEIASLQARVDKALADGEAGDMRILEAEKNTKAAQLDLVEHSIRQAEVRAPEPGVIVEGDLRQMLGGNVSKGESLFRLARHDRMAVVLEVPENLVLSARDCTSASFSPSARPEARYELQDLRMAPASTVVDKKNVFLCESIAEATLESLPPGMEGVAYLDVGYRSAWWVLTHRVTDWLRLQFWF